MRKGLSELISTVVLIVVVMAIGAFVAPWALNLVRTSTNQTASNTDMQLLCQNVGYDLDNNYGSSGLIWNLTDSNTTLKAKISNTGTISLYSFTFDIIINSSLIYEVAVNDTYQKTANNPLQPGQTTILVMNATQDYNDTLTEVTIRNAVCPSLSITRKL